MKTNLFLIFTFFMVYSSFSQKNLEKATIHTLINNWHKNAANTHYQKYFDIMEKNSIFIGTDATESWTKKEFQKYSKPFFDKGKAWSFFPIERNIYLSKNKKVAWFDELLNTQMGICRGSGVLEKTKDGQWKIKHYVLSMSIPNKKANPIIKIKKETDSLLLQNYKHIK